MIIIFIFLFQEVFAECIDAMQEKDVMITKVWKLFYMN